VTLQPFTEADFCACFEEPSPFSLFKLAITQQNDQLKQRFNPERSIAGLLSEKACFIDNLLTACWHHFLSHEETL
jgi:[protein-PII] uridylyltransferase